MIGISEDDLSLDIILEVLVIYAFYRSYGTDRHEDRSLYLSVICSDDSTSCSGVRIIMCLDEFHSNLFNPQR
jgi:hypothetical protein